MSAVVAFILGVLFGSVLIIVLGLCVSAGKETPQQNKEKKYPSKEEVAAGRYLVVNRADPTTERPTIRPTSDDIPDLTTALKPPPPREFVIKIKESK